MSRSGQKLYSNGYRPNHPILVIPGLCCSVLKVEDSPYEPWVGRNIWLDISMVGLDKFTDGLPLFGGRKKKKIARDIKSDKLKISGPANFRANTLGSKDVLLIRDMETNEEIEMAEVDSESKRRWIAHMVMAADHVSDPQGIRVRPVRGLDGCAYLDPKMKAFSYVWGPFFEVLQGIGYNDTNLQAATYDWRVPPNVLEKRDGYFTEVALMVRKMVRANQKPVVIIGHSLGTRCADYFLRWAELHKGREWISKNIHSFIAVGPLFLGAPKSVRATVSGERMGLDAFLFPQEGVALSRQVGSSPWMYPSFPLDFNLKSFAQVRNEYGGYKACTMTQLFAKGGCQELYQLWEEHYKNDPLFGDDKVRRTPPPVDRLWAIYGINLPTETMYFYRPTEGGITDLALDPDGTIPGYKCQNGIAYETRNTPQVDGRSASGDGTVPYASMAYCKKWKNSDSIEVTVTELDKCDHRDILKDSRFVDYMVEFLCTQITSLNIPESLPDIRIDVYLGSGNIGRKSKLRKLIVGQQNVELQHSGDTESSFMYPDIISARSVGNTLNIAVQGKKRPLELSTESAFTLALEIQSRVSYLMALRASVSAGFHDTRDELGQTALHRAVQSKDEAKVTELLSSTAQLVDVNAVDVKGFSPLHQSMADASYKICQVLLNHKDIKVNVPSKDGASPLLVAMRHKLDDQWHITEPILKLLIDKGCDVNLPNVSGITPLHQAVTRQQILTVEWLLQHRADPNLANDAGDTAMHAVVRTDNEIIAKLLIANNADPLVRNTEGKTPLALARSMSQSLFEMIQESDGQGAAAHYGPEADEIGQTALHRAVMENQAEQAYQLLQEGSSVNFADRYGFTPLLMAAQRGYIDLVLLFLTIPATKLTVTNTGSTLLHLLAQANIPRSEAKRLSLVLQQTSERGAQLDATDGDGLTPLHLAASKSNHMVLQWLLKQKANVNQLSPKGLSPLYMALQPSTRDINVIRSLVRAKADINLSDKGSATPLALARQLDDAVPWRTVSLATVIQEDQGPEEFDFPLDYSDSPRVEVTGTAAGGSGTITKASSGPVKSPRGGSDKRASTRSPSVPFVTAVPSVQVSGSPSPTPTPSSSSSSSSSSWLRRKFATGSMSLGNQSIERSGGSSVGDSGGASAPIDPSLESIVAAIRALPPLVASATHPKGRLRISLASDSAGTSVEYLAGALAVTPEEFAETLQKAQQELQRLSQERKQQLLSVVMEL